MLPPLLPIFDSVDFTKAFSDGTCQFARLILDMFEVMR